MGFSVAEIILDSPKAVYFSGQTLFGKLRFTQEKPTVVKGIYIKIVGGAHVNWTDKEGQNNENKHFESSEFYFKYLDYLYGKKDGSCLLESGEHEFPFQCQIPSSSPSSFEGKYGYIRYNIRAAMIGQYVPKIEKIMPFRVVMPMNLNLVSLGLEPLQFRLEDEYCCMCVYRGKVKVLVALPSTAFCIGDVVPVELTCVNESTVDVTEIKLKIKKQTTFHAPEKLATKTTSDLITETLTAGVTGNSKRRWSIKLVVPSIDVCNVTSCNLIDVLYMLKVKVETSAFHFGIEETKMIYMGDVPLRTATPPVETTQPKSYPSPPPLGFIGSQTITYQPQPTPSTPYSPFPPNPYPETPLSPFTFLNYPNSQPCPNNNEHHAKCDQSPIVTVHQPADKTSIYPKNIKDMEYTPGLKMNDIPKLVVTSPTPVKRDKGMGDATPSFSVQPASPISPYDGASAPDISSPESLFDTKPVTESTSPTMGKKNPPYNPEFMK